MVFYRKYRSQTIDQLDSSAVREKLGAVLKKDIPHAFLFTGPKGLGKTSTARIIAKSVNCTDKKEGSIEPCNKCEQCLAITNGTSIDILEIDAASNRGIDEIRELKEKIRLSPVSSLKKVYIIDEVHMLTTEAFNALLKTLEEPPEHAMFILCTTEPQKVPSTILSRCFHISFQLATTEELVRSFKRIAKGENAEISDEALEMVAQLADGGFRDGAKMIEELLTLAQGNPITKEFIEEKYKVSSIKHLVSAMVDALAAKDAKESLLLVARLAEQGVDIKYFIQQLMEFLHTELLSQIDKKKDGKLSTDAIRVLFGLLTRAFNEMKFTVLPQLPLELAVLEYCSLSDANVKEAAASPPIMADPGVSVMSLRKQVGTMKRIKALYGEPKKQPAADEEKVETTTVELMHTSGDGDVTKEWLDAFWKSLLTEMKKHNHTVAGVLRGCAIKSFNKNEIVLQTAYAFHKERLEEMKNRDALVSICKLLTGNEMEIRVELRKG